MKLHSPKNKGRKRREKLQTWKANNHNTRRQKKKNAKQKQNKK